MQTTGNGKVYVAQPLDWEEKAFYSLNISITDGVNTIYTLVNRKFPFNLIAINLKRGKFVFFVFVVGYYSTGC